MIRNIFSKYPNDIELHPNLSVIFLSSSGESRTTHAHAAHQIRPIVPKT